MMAANYMAVQGSSVPCERQFSSAGLIDTKRCNRLLAKKFNCIEFLKSSYNQDVFTSNAEALKRSNSEIESDCDENPRKRAHLEE